MTWKEDRTRAVGYVWGTFNNAPGGYEPRCWLRISLTRFRPLELAATPEDAKKPTEPVVVKGILRPYVLARVQRADETVFNGHESGFRVLEVVAEPRST